ncbi:MAG TPA: SDR family oxidoreductase [Pseudonocardia sp.]|jgi:3-oxoacyl-[acyl-carrier protein] reductase|uniref:SDR family oxidoreductase n=1 Tax=Pseudonocardia sp. TaxID=60912 RepID=UPI002B4B1A60|nr:SDR family oxidoreductase [Pseudonocardia sp.]HLU56178.1 SDR family oxidoreductase [Pseudonocardia sp.]
MDTGLKGRTAVVPGASSGLGLAVARSLAAEGANVVLGGRRGELVREEAAKLPSAVGVEVDITDPAAADALVGAAIERFGPVDVLVLNGGGPPPGTAVDFTPEQLTDAVNLLVAPHQRLVRAVLPGMRERGFGRIVAIGSSGVQSPIERLVASNAGRAALAGYLKTLASEVAADGVTVNMVLPGRIATDRVGVLDRANAERTGKTEEEVREAAMAAIPAKRYGTPEEFAAVVTFLASTAASYVTGEQVRCDGGLVRTH